MVSENYDGEAYAGYVFVLILVLVEDGLGVIWTIVDERTGVCLNPCFGGRWSRRKLKAQLAAAEDAS